MLWYKDVPTVPTESPIVACATGANIVIKLVCAIAAILTGVAGTLVDILRIMFKCIRKQYMIRLGI